MKVLYVSKALVVAAYREKVRQLGERVSVRAVMPDRWEGDMPEPSPFGLEEPDRARVRLPGHNHLHFYARASRWIATPAPDLAHIDEEPYSLVTLQLTRLCRRRGIPSLFFTWQNLERRLPPPFGRIRSAVFAAVRGGIAGSEGAAEVVRRAGYAGPLAVIPQFGVDPERFRADPSARVSARERLGVPPDAFVAGFAGRLVPEKGVRVLLRSFSALHSAAPGAKRPYLVLIGQGPERSRLEAEARAAGVADRVRFTGHVASLDMPAALAPLDALVLPSVGTRSWTEQFGRVLVEAMACGVPVVGSATGEIPSVIGDAGAVVPPGDATALAATLERLRAAPELRARRAEQGRRRVLERYTHAHVARATADFYAGLLDVGRAA